MRRYYLDSQGLAELFAGYGQGRRQAQLQESQMQAKANAQQNAGVDRLFGTIASAGIGAGFGALGAAMGGPVGQAIASSVGADTGYRRGGGGGDAAGYGELLQGIFGGDGGGDYAQAPADFSGVPGSGLAGPPTVEAAGFVQQQQAQPNSVPLPAIDPTSIPQFREAQNRLVQYEAIAKDVVTSAKPLAEKQAILSTLMPEIQRSRQIVQSYPRPKPPSTPEELAALGPHGGGFTMLPDGSMILPKGLTRAAGPKAAPTQGPTRVRIQGVEQPVEMGPNEVLETPTAVYTTDQNGTPKVTLKKDDDDTAGGIDEDALKKAIELAKSAQNAEKKIEFNKESIKKAYREIVGAKQDLTPKERTPEEVVKRADAIIINADYEKIPPDIIMNTLEEFRQAYQGKEIPPEVAQRIIALRDLQR